MRMINGENITEKIIEIKLTRWVIKFSITDTDVTVMAEMSLIVKSKQRIILCLINNSWYFSNSHQHFET